VVRAGRYDLVWMEKELLPFTPDWLERILHAIGVPVVVDYDDAIFHRYDQHRSSLVRSTLGRKIDRVMASATLVIAGNAYLAERARAAGAAEVEILPTVIDLEKYPGPRWTERTPVTVGWIGSPSTQEYLRHIGPALARFCEETGGRVQAIGVEERFQLEGVPLEAVPWSKETELAALQALDVGIMPLADSPWERGKCGFKLIQYMACGLPVVASPVGANREIVIDGETGALAATQDEWVSALKSLAGDAARRRRMGEAGRARVVSGYSLQAVAPRLAALLRRAAGTRSCRRAG
jgi:glycosyltransferase involved in cell wall biosynthesis